MVHVYRTAEPLLRTESLSDDAAHTDTRKEKKREKHSHHMVVIIILKDHNGGFSQARTKTNGRLEGGECLECGSLSKTLCSKAKYTQFVLNGFKRGKKNPPVWF